MEIWMLWILYAVFFAGQLICCRCRKIWVRLLPLFLALGLMAACIAGYLLSSRENWGFIILLLLSSGALVAVGAAWVLFDMIRRGLQRIKKDPV